MRHYVYYSYEEWGRGYIGVKSSEDPVNDRYFGSYVDPTFQPTNKIIIAEFPTREEAQLAEIYLHEFFEVSENPHFANRCKATNTGFSCMGRKDTPETTEKRRKAQSGENNPMCGKAGHAMPHRSESKEKMSISQKERFQREPNPFKGRKHSPETRKKMSEAAKRRDPNLVALKVEAMKKANLERYSK